MKPAIFNTDMVRAILDGRKTNTRRIIKDQILANLVASGSDNVAYDEFIQRNSPYKKGDIIYVRETFVVGIPDGTMPESEQNPLTIFYKADDSVHGWMDEWEEEINIPWKPSIHMPKEYARLFLRVKDVRIERLNEISEEDAIAEGITEEYHRDIVGMKCYGGYPVEIYGDVRHFLSPNSKDFFESAEYAFAYLWESIYGKDSFNDDYVWVIEFEKITKEEAME